MSEPRLGSPEFIHEDKTGRGNWIDRPNKLGGTMGTSRSIWPTSQGGGQKTARNRAVMCNARNIAVTHLTYDYTAPLTYDGQGNRVIYSETVAGGDQVEERWRRYNIECRTLDNPRGRQGQADLVIHVETAEREPDRFSQLPPRPPVAGVGAPFLERSCLGAMSTAPPRQRGE